MTQRINELRIDPDLESVTFFDNFPRALLMAQTLGCKTNARSILIEPTQRRIWAVVPALDAASIQKKLDGWLMHSIHNGELTPPCGPVNF